ncbi:acetylornithine deacetylase [Phyllosticta capitalensis]
MRSSLIAAALSLFTAVGSAAQIAFPNAFLLSEHKDPDHLLPLPTLHELLILHRELIKQPSITYSEYEQGWWLVSYLKEAGWSVETQQVGCRMMGKERFNILAWPGKEKPTRGTLLTTHYDTVPPYIPYSFDPKNSLVSGRGSVDAKGSLAAMIIAAIDLLGRSDNPINEDDISLLFVVGEETGGDGMRTFSDSPLNSANYNAVIFGEPTENKLASGHKGSFGFEIRVTGKEAHSGYPWLGLSANNVLVASLAKLLSLESGQVKGLHLPWSEKYGNTTMNIGTIHGGVAHNVVAKNATAYIAGRLAESTPEDVEATITAALAPFVNAVEEKGGSLEIEFGEGGYGPVDANCDIEGFECITVNYGTDIHFLKGNHKRYLYGPGSIHVAHSDVEAVSVWDLEKAVIDYQKLILASYWREK